MKFNLGCQLKYNINQPSTLVFNLSVINNEYQRILQENLNIDPKTDYDEYIDPYAKNRYFRINASSGELEVSYQATVELSHFYAEPKEVSEVPPVVLQKREQ